VVVHDNDRDDNGEGGDPPVPNDAAASGGGDDDNTSPWMRSGGGMTDGGGGGVGRAHVGHRRDRRRVGHVYCTKFYKKGVWGISLPGYGQNLVHKRFYVLRTYFSLRRPFRYPPTNIPVKNHESPNTIRESNLP
jgi:hypothetical protein